MKYKVLSKLKCKKNPLIRTQAKVMRSCFPEEDSQIRSMHLKACLTPLAIEEMQIKTSIKGQVYSSMVGSCLAYGRPWTPTPALQKKSKNN
jgi:hypothetical protein